MRIVKNVKWYFEDKLWEMKHYFEVRKCKRLYPDYEDNEFNVGSLKHVWGVTSWNDLTGRDSSIYTMNDIDITYDRKSKLYMLGIETHYMFKDKKSECEYPEQLLETFTKFMNENNYAIDYEYNLFCSIPTITSSAESIEELYANFKMFVLGYCVAYK